MNLKIDKCAVEVASREYLLRLNNRGSQLANHEGEL
jgi:hypothetical protein